MVTLTRIIAVLSSTLLCASGSYAESSVMETKIKAAYLYNFTKFVTWPESQDKPLTICIAGDTDLARMLENAVGKSNERLIINTSIRNGTGECNLLYLSEGDTRFDTLLGGAGGKNILTVSDAKKFDERGGIVTLFDENGKIRFNINSAAARKTNLKISSKLMELSRETR